MFIASPFLMPGAPAERNMRWACLVYIPLLTERDKSLLSSYTHIAPPEQVVLIESVRSIPVSRFPNSAEATIKEKSV